MQNIVERGTMQCEEEYVVDEEKDYSNWLAKQISFENMLAKNNLEKNLLIAENKN